MLALRAGATQTVGSLAFCTLLDATTISEAVSSIPDTSLAFTITSSRMHAKRVVYKVETTQPTMCLQQLQSLHTYLLIPAL
jgi:hypothetical protein